MIPRADGSQRPLSIHDGSADGFRSALLRLISDGALRERIGRAAYARAMAEWAPAKTEQRYVEIYQQILGTVGCRP